MESVTLPLPKVAVYSHSSRVGAREDRDVFVVFPVLKPFRRRPPYQTKKATV